MFAVNLDSRLSRRVPDGPDLSEREALPAVNRQETVPFDYERVTGSKRSHRCLAPKIKIKSGGRHLLGLDRSGRGLTCGVLVEGFGAWAGWVAVVEGWFLVGLHQRFPGE